MAYTQRKFDVPALEFYMIKLLGQHLMMLRDAE